MRGDSEYVLRVLFIFSRIGVLTPGSLCVGSAGQAEAPLSNLFVTLPTSTTTVCSTRAKAPAP